MNLRLETTMEQTTDGATMTKPQPSRPTTSRKLLARKAIERSTLKHDDAPEPRFPEGVNGLEETTAAPHGSSSSAPTAAVAQPPAAPAPWSSEDEAGFQALIARRKAAGYQRRGKDVSAQVLRPSNITPNAETVVATIVGIVAERGSIARSALIELMGLATFPHPKAQPTDKGWCQGYVAGAIRNGFLTVEHSTTGTPVKEV